MSRYDLAPVARFMLGLYAVGFLYLLFSPSPPRPPGGSELVGHFALFLGLGLLVGWSWPVLSPVWRVRAVLVVGVFASVGTELVQARLPARMFEWSDLAANLLGTMAAAVVVPVWREPAAVAEEVPEGPASQHAGEDAEE